jgi:hypothetical protein
VHQILTRLLTARRLSRHNAFVIRPAFTVAIPHSIALSGECYMGVAV